MQWHNEKLGLWGLPTTWKYPDGRTVSNYHLLSDEKHINNGWQLEEKPVEEKVYVEPEPTVEERLAVLEGKVKTLETEATKSIG